MNMVYHFQAFCLLFIPHSFLFFFTFFSYTGIVCLGTKLLLNARLNKFLKVTRQSDKMVQLVCVNYADLQNNTASTATIGTYLIKTKNTEDADDIFEIATDFVNKSISADKTLTSSEEAPSEEQK